MDVWSSGDCHLAPKPEAEADSAAPLQKELLTTALNIIKLSIRLSVSPALQRAPPGNPEVHYAAQCNEAQNKLGAAGALREEMSTGSLCIAALHSTVGGFL